MPFQKTVNAHQAPAVAGDFASANPHTVMLAGEGTLVNRHTGGLEIIKSKRWSFTYVNRHTGGLEI